MGLAASMAVVAGQAADCGGSGRHSAMHGDSHPVSTGSPAPMTMGPTASGPLSLPTESPAGPLVWPAPMVRMGPGMVMATPACAAAPNTAQRQAAVDLTNRTVAAVARYRSLTVAKADGGRPNSRAAGPPPARPPTQRRDQVIRRAGDLVLDVVGRVVSV